MDQRILVIEDNVITLDEIEIRLNDLGYTVIETATNGQEAIQKANTFSPDLIISDINLGEGIDGIEAVGTITSKLNVPVIYLTAYDDEETLSRAKITEPYAYLVKPLQERELNIAISIAFYKHKIEAQLRKVNKDLEDAIALKNKFFSIIAHDLRSPFSGFIGLSQLLNRDTDNLTTDQIKQIAGSMQKSANSVYTLIENLFKWSSTESGTMPFDPGILNINDLIKNVTFLMQYNAKQKGIDLMCNCPEDLLAYCDNNMTTSVIRNLVSNAIKFTGEKGTITVGAFQEGNKIKVFVRDNGIGIESHIMDKLFELNKDKIQLGTHKEKGSGLGLVLCKQFVEKQGGRIWAESKSGLGSTFYFVLPMNDLE